MSLFNMLDFIGNATYKPEVNTDLYGVDQQGNFVDKDGNRVSPYVTPGWFSRATSPEARQVGLYNAQAQLAPEEAQKQEAITRNIRQGAVQTMPENTWAVPGNLAASTTSSLYPNLSPLATNPQRQAFAYGQTGAPAQTGLLSGQADIAQAHRMLQESQAALQRQSVVDATRDAEVSNELATAIHVTPLEIQHNINTLRGQLGRDPTEQEILDFQAKVGQAQGASQVRNIPVNYGPGGTSDLQAQNQNFMQRFGIEPGMLTTAPYLTETTAQGIVPPQGLSKYFMPRQFATLQALQRGGMAALTGGGVGATLPDGTPLPMKPNAERVIRPSNEQEPVVEQAAPAESPPTTGQVARPPVAELQRQAAKTSSKQYGQIAGALVNPQAWAMRHPQEADNTEAIYRAALAGLISPTAWGQYYKMHPIKNYVEPFLEGMNQ